MTKEIVVSSLNDAEIAVRDAELRFANVVYDVTTILGDKSAKAIKSELTSIRTSIEKTRKVLKQPFIDEGKKIDDLAKALTERVVALEKPLLQCYKAAEQNAADAAKAEADKKQRYNEGIVGLGMGQPDYSSKDTEPKVAAEYLQEQFGNDHGKLMNLISGSRSDIKE